MRKYYHTLLRASLFVLFFKYHFAFSESLSGHMPVFKIHIKGHTYQTWIAVDKAQYYQGLKQISAQELAGKAMLFTYPKRYTPTYTMQGTLTDIDLLCLDEQGIILQIMLMKTKESHLYTPLVPCRYGLELPGGTAHTHQLKPGDSVQLPSQVMNAKLL